MSKTATILASDVEMTDVSSGYKDTTGKGDTHRGIFRPTMARFDPKGHCKHLNRNNIKQRRQWTPLPDTTGRIKEITGVTIN